MESYIGHGGQFLFPFLFGKDLQVIFFHGDFIIINFLVKSFTYGYLILIDSMYWVSLDPGVKSFVTIFCPIMSLLTCQVLNCRVWKLSQHYEVLQPVRMVWITY